MRKKQVCFTYFKSHYKILPLSVFVVHFHQSFIGYDIWYMNNTNGWKICEKLFTKNIMANILSQIGCNSSNGVSFNQLYILWIELWKKKICMCVTRPQTINNNQNETLSRLATYPSAISSIVSSFCKPCRWMKVWMEWVTTKTKIKHEWINMFNHNVGSNLQNKWLITIFKFLSKCHFKVLHLNEILNI